jgi:hypothetical protein
MALPVSLSVGFKTPTQSIEGLDGEEAVLSLPYAYAPLEVPYMRMNDKNVKWKSKISRSKLQ